MAMIWLAVILVVVSALLGLRQSGPGPVPAVGSVAPAFTLPCQDGSTVRLADLRGQWVVLYFYPKDKTPG